jgi:hypothetical protein
LVHRTPGPDGSANISEAGEADGPVVPGFEDVRVVLVQVLPAR